MSKVKYFFVVMTFFLLLPVSGSSKEIITLASLNWVPYIGEDITDNGYVADIAKESFKRKGYKIKIEFMPWARVKLLAENGKVDGYFPEYWADKLKKKFALSESFQGGPLGFFKLKSKAIKFSNLSDLKPYSIGIVRGYVNTAEFDNAIFLQKQEARNDETNFKKLLAGRIDLFISDKYVGLNLIKKMFAEKAGSIEFMEPALEEKNLHICFGKQNPRHKEYLEAFNSGLKEIKQDGTMKNILTKHGF